MNVSNYKFIKILGSGTFGEVAQYKKDGKLYAIKKMKREFDRRKNKYTIFRSLNELSSMKRFDHPNLMKCIEFFMDEEYYYFVLPFYTYGDLRQVIKLGLSFEEKIKIIHQLASAVWCLHQNGYYHCDLKGPNIFLDDEFNCVLADFSYIFPIHITNSICTTAPYNSTPQFLYEWMKRGKQGIVGYEMKKEDNEVLKKLEKDHGSIVRQSGDRVKADIWCLCNIFTSILGDGPLMLPYQEIPNYMSDKDSFIEKYVESLKMDEENKNALFDLIELMMEPDLSKSTVSMMEVFSSEFFQLNDITEPIPGSCLHFQQYSIPKNMTQDIEECLDWVIFFYEYFCNETEKKEVYQKNHIQFLFHTFDIIYRTYPSIELKNKKNNSYLIAYVALAISRLSLFESPFFNFPIPEKLFDLYSEILDKKVVFDISIYQSIEFQILNLLDGIPLMNTLFNVSKTKIEIDKAFCAMIHINTYEKILNSKLLSDKNMNRYLPLNEEQINAHYSDTIQRLKKMKPN